jgi:hypothetical protein
MLLMQAAIRSLSNAAMIGDLQAQPGLAALYRKIDLKSKLHEYDLTLLSDEELNDCCMIAKNIHRPNRQTKVQPRLVDLQATRDLAGHVRHFESY